MLAVNCTGLQSNKRNRCYSACEIVTRDGHDTAHKPKSGTNMSWFKAPIQTDVQERHLPQIFARLLSSLVVWGHLNLTAGHCGVRS